MGTRGYYVIKWKHLYYIFYNHWDSYLEGLGADIVKELRELFEADFDKLRTVIEGVQVGPDEWVKKKGYEGLMKLAENPGEYDLWKISSDSPNSGDGIEYVYIVNLDVESFQVRFKQYISEEIGNFEWEQIDWEFPIKKIPENWIEQIGKK